MKTARITLLGTAEFKALLQQEAERDGVSVSEWVRRRCVLPQSEENVQLAEMAAELARSVVDARRSLEDGLNAIERALNEVPVASRERAA